MRVKKMMRNKNRRLRRQFMAIALSLLMVLGVAATALAAQGETDDTDSATGDAADTATGDAAADETTPVPETINYETVYIDDADDLIALAKNCTLDTWSRDKRVVLRADISLENTQFETIPIFSGIFDGGGYTLDGLNLTGSFYPSGLFGIIQAGAVVKSLNVNGTVSPSGDADAVGGIAGINYGTISDSTFTGTVNGKSSTGGIAGINSMTGYIQSCKSYGGVFGQHATGGITGTNLGVVIRCVNACYVNVASVDPTFAPEDLAVDLTKSVAQFASTDGLNTSTDTGGIVGYSSGSIQSCSNSGAIGYQHIGYNVGGIAGRSCGYIAICKNTGAVCGRKDAGGVVGQMEPYIDANLSMNLLAELKAEIDELTALIDKAIDDTDGSVQSASSRLNKMADYMDAAANAVGNMTAYASVVSTVTGEGLASSSGSGDATAPSVSVSGDIGSGVEVSGDPVSAGGESAASAVGTVSATSQIKVNASQHKLSAALSGMTKELRLLNGEMSGASTTLSDDVRAINDQADRIADTAMALFTAVETGDTDSLITDASDVDIDAVTYGKVTLCNNIGKVYGDIDVGGIAGSMAIEYELDPEDDVSSDLSAGVQSRYELKAIIMGCESSGDITAKRDCVGGICGRMDLGLILRANGYGSVTSESGDYVGGISGFSSSTIRSCYVKCTLSGRNDIGGVTGSGSDADENRAGSMTEKCYVIVRITDASQYAGAVSGSDKGEFADNYFVSDDLTGLGMASYSGRAEPIAYAKLVKEPTVPIELRGFTLRFVADGVVIDSKVFQYNDSFDSDIFPPIPPKEGYYAVWDTQMLNNLRFDTVVTAVYTPYITALSSEDTRGNGRPILFVEGAFCDQDSLCMSAEAKTPQEFSELPASLQEAAEKYFSCFERGELPASYICREIVEQWQIELPDDGQATHTVRYLSPDERASNLKVFCKQDGAWKELKSEEIGSYLSFTVSGSQAEIAILSVLPIWWIWLIAAALLLFIILLIAHGIKKAKRRRKKNGRDDSTGPEKHKASKKHKNHLLRALIAVLLLLCAAVAFLLFLNSDFGTGLGALRLLRSFSAKDSVSMELEVSAGIGSEQLSTEALIDRVTESDHQISCITQSGVTLYYADGSVYLGNGKGYQASGLFPDYSLLLERAADLYESADISRESDGENNIYTITAQGENARSLLSLLLPAFSDQLSSVDSMTVKLVSANGTLSQMQFSGGGKLNDEDGTAVSVLATLTVLASANDSKVPQAVLDSVLAGSACDEELGETVFRLLKAFSEWNARDPLFADIQLEADCGPLLLNTELTYFKTVSDGLTVNCIRKNGLSLYFTTDAVCLADGSAAPDSEASSTKCSELLDIAYEALLNGTAACEEADGTYTYSLSLTEDAMRRAASAIAPDTEAMDISLTAGSIQLDIVNGTVNAIRFSISGSTQIVLTQAQTSLDAEMSFLSNMTGDDCAVPDAVLSALKK